MDGAGIRFSWVEFSTKELETVGGMLSRGLGKECGLMEVWKGCGKEGSDLV